MESKSAKKVSTLLLACDGSRVLLGMKKRGFGAGRWNGFGGKVEPGETIEESAKREMLEEVGIEVVELEKRAIMEFKLAGEPSLLEIHLFKVLSWKGEPVETEEMRPQWFDSANLPFSEMWPDDRHWFPIFLAEKKFFGKAFFPDQNTIEEFSFDEVDDFPVKSL